MPDESDERGVDEAASQSPRAERSNVTPVAFGSGLRLDDAFDLGDDDLNDADDSDIDAVDISLVHADDAFLDALGGAVRGERLPASRDLPDDFRGDDFRGDELAALLCSWRDEVDAAPIGELVDTKLAVATVYAAKARKRRRPRLLVPFAAAAAVLAIAFTGAGLAAQDARPGDPLWGLTKVLYADHARSVEAAVSVRQDLDIAQTALAQGKVAEAKSKLEEAQLGLPSIASEDGAADLAAEHQDLLSKLGVPANGVQPPPSANPSSAVPVPTTTPSTTTHSVSVTVSTSSPSTSTTTSESTSSSPSTTTSETPTGPAKVDPGTTPEETGQGTQSIRLTEAVQTPEPPASSP
ncbi:anti-sigma-D factor RsdA [Actinokineospora iranica]|uniref:Anti-sigma-D factor RsdA to sigma factor binding region n=1 Tax=Actinokineospora iranica TaxID=1271860 RepID=A0A1G6Z8B7_9PSEU|nr:anti-sigma-D factor RsdA [Actinokineospora iranica]SDD98237.1 Anti-sigma-D factor RsdA to sigma factor binding region [Actinokineospora iranica]